MATYVTDDGICLRVTDFSETSQIVGMFTRKHGLVPLIAKGSKRASKRNVVSGPLDLLTSGEVVFVPAREASIGGGGGTNGRGSGGAQLGTLAEWELVDHRRDLRRNLEALSAGMICAEVTTHLVQAHDPHPDIFAELEAALDLLGKQPQQAARTLTAYIKAALIGAGFWPRFAACAACGRSVRLDTSMWFSPSAGGVFCGEEQGSGRNCRAGTSGKIIAVEGKILIGLDRLALPSAMRAIPPERPADERSLAAALQLLFRHLESITDRGLRTENLLKAIFPAGRLPTDLPA